VSPARRESSEIFGKSSPGATGGGALEAADDDDQPHCAATPGQVQEPVSVAIMHLATSIPHSGGC
jgi:hypothetical protein